MRQCWTTRTAVMLAVMLLTLSPVAGVVSLTSQAAASPDGFVGVPDSNIQDDLPVDHSSELTAADLEGSVMASQYASSLQVVVTTPDRAKEYVGSKVGGAGGVALIFQDDSNHAGREVAVPADAIRQAVGHVPKLVHGRHEDGSSWTAQVEARNGLLIWEIPKFSSNSVTFEGQVNVDATPAVDGSSYSYDAGQPDTVDDFQINVTGSTASTWDNESAAALADGDSMSLEIGGNADPTGPTVSDEPRVVFAGRNTTFSESTSGTGAADGSSTSLSVGGDAAPQNAQVTFSGVETTGSRYTPSGTGDGSISVNGNQDPIGPSAGGQPEVTFTGETVTTGTITRTGSMAVGGSNSESVTGNVDPTNANLEVTGKRQISSESHPYEVEMGWDDYDDAPLPNPDGEIVINNVPDTVDQIYLGSMQYYARSGADNSDDVALEVYISSGDTSGNGVYTDGTHVGNYSFGPAHDSLDSDDHGYEKTINLPSDFDASGSNKVTIEFDYINWGSEQEELHLMFKNQDLNYDSWADVRSPPPTSVTVDDGQGNTVSYGDFGDGETKTKAFPISHDATALSSTGMNGVLDYTLTYDERKTTVDPSVDVDGDGSADATYTGMLSDGDTVTKELSALSSSSSTVDTSVSEGGLPSWTITYDARYATEDPSVDVDGDGSADASYTGVLQSGETATVSLSSLEAGSPSADFSLTGGETDWTIQYDRVEHTEDPSVDVDADGTPEASYSGTLAPGQTATAPLNLSLQDSSLQIGTAGNTTTDVTVELEERTETVNPKVVVNGNPTGGATVGRLADGETASLATDTSWIQDGQNNITVQVGDGTLTADAPTPQVELAYTHSAKVLVDATYVADGWLEEYNASTTFASDRTDPKAIVPFSSEVYDVTHVEQSVNGGSWDAVPTADWSLQNGTQLVIHLDDADGSPGVEAGDEIAIRTAGQKVQVQNGEITVLDPTDPSDTGLDTEFRVDSKSPGFAIDVSGTRNADRVHYTYKEDWTAEESAVIDADGSQTLYFPNVEAGGTARVTTIPLSASLNSGDVGIHVVDPDEPALEITPGKSGYGDMVTFRYYAVSSGETYGLYSVSRGRYMDKADAGAEYVALTDDDSEETLAFKIPSESSVGGSSSGSSSGIVAASSGVWEDPTEGVSLQEIGVAVGWVAVVLLLVAATGRSSLYGRRRWLLVGSVSVGTGLLSLELIRPGSVVGAVSGGLAEIIPLAGLAAIGLAGYSIVSWWQARQKEAGTPETEITLDLGGRSD